MKLLFSFLAIILAVVVYFNVIIESDSKQVPEAITKNIVKTVINGVAKEVHDEMSLTQKSEVYDQWLKDQFEVKHKNLMPVVAVADMFWTCNKNRQPSAKQYSLKQLVNVMDKNTLASKLATCLGTDKIKSEQALNFGLLACFSEQLKVFPKNVQAEKIKIVEDSFLSLSREQRQKSFTKCISEQAMDYL